MGIKLQSILLLWFTRLQSIWIWEKIITDRRLWQRIWHGSADLHRSCHGSADLHGKLPRIGRFACPYSSPRNIPWVLTWLFWLMWNDKTFSIIILFLYSLKIKLGLSVYCTHTCNAPLIILLNLKFERYKCHFYQTTPRKFPCHPPFLQAACWALCTYYWYFSLSSSPMLPVECNKPHDKH